MDDALRDQVIKVLRAVGAEDAAWPSPGETWALLWSYRANAIHVELLQRAIAAGLRIFSENGRTDYLVLAVGSRELIDETADLIRPVLEKRAASLAAKDADD